MNIGARFGGNRIEPATLPHGGCVGSRAASCAYKHLFSAAAVRCCAAISPDHCSGCLHIIWLNYVQLQGVCARSVSEEFWRLRRISLPMTSPPSLISRLSYHCQLSVMQFPVPISVCDSYDASLLHASSWHFFLEKEGDVLAQDGHVHVTAKLDDDAWVCKRVLLCTPVPICACSCAYRSRLPECCLLSEGLLLCQQKVCRHTATLSNTRLGNRQPRPILFSKFADRLRTTVMTKVDVAQTRRRGARTAPMHLLPGCVQRRPTLLASTRASSCQVAHTLCPMSGEPGRRLHPDAPVVPPGRVVSGGATGVMR